MTDHFPILIVDNNDAYRKTLREYLEECGYRIIEARNADEALEKLLENKPVLATVDVRLVDDDDPHDHSGLKLIHSLPEEIPVIVITAHEDAQAVRNAYGAAPGKITPKAYLFKGEGLEAIKSTIALHFPRERQWELRSSKPISLKAIVLWFIPVAIITVTLFFIFNQQLIAAVLGLLGSVLAEVLAGALTTFGKRTATKLLKSSQTKIQRR